MSRVSVTAWRKPVDERGFTLIETVLTLAIIVVVLGIALSAIRIGLRSWEMGEVFVDDASSKRAVVSKLFVDITSVSFYLDRQENTAGILFNGGPKSLGFVTVAGVGLSGLPWGGAKWVYYSVRDGRLTVREKTVPAENVRADEGGRLVELDTGVREVSFEYLGQGGWVEQWIADRTESLPMAVRVKVSYDESKKTFVESFAVGLTHEKL